MKRIIIIGWLTFFGLMFIAAYFIFYYPVTMNTVIPPQAEEACLQHSGSQKEHCIYAYLLDNEIEFDETLCREGFENFDIQDICLNYLLYKEIIENADPDRCEDFIGAIRDACYHTLAQTLRDLTLCPFITDSDAKDLCYHGLASQLEDANVCESIFNKGIIDDCIKEVAILSNDLTLCQNLETKYVECINGIAKIRQDEAICDYLEQEENKLICIAQIYEDN